MIHEHILIEHIYSLFIQNSKLIWLFNNVSELQFISNFLSNLSPPIIEQKTHTSITTNPFFLMKKHKFRMERKIADSTLGLSHDFTVNQRQHFGLTIIDTLHPVAITRRLNISTERGPIFLQLLFEQSVCCVTVSLRNRENTKDGHQVVQFSTELVEIS